MAGNVPGQAGARRTLFLCSLGFFLITLDILIVNVALTSIGRELDGGTAALQWVIDAYTLLFAALLLLAGNLSERFGAKRAFGIGITVFLLASIACTAAPSVGILIAARAVQGAGAAMMLPASMALIREAFPDGRERAKALGIWAVGGAVAGAIGPVLGGALTTLDWRLVFAINLPVCVVMLLLLRTVAHSSPHVSPFDWAGQFVSVVALTALVFGLIEGGSIGFNDPFVITSLIVAIVGIGVFLLIQARAAHPMMPLDLFRSGGMRISLAVGFAFMVANFGTVFVLSLFLQQYLGLSPLLAGLVFLPSAAFAIVGNLISGRLANHFGPRVPVVSGLLLIVVGLLGAIFTAPLGSPVLVGLFACFTGAGGSVAMPPVTSVVLASVPSARAGTASAVFNTFRQVGGAVAIAVFGAFIADRTHFVAGLQLSFIVTAVLVFAVAIASMFIPRVPSTMATPGAAKAASNVAAALTCSQSGSEPPGHCRGCGEPGALRVGAQGVVADDAVLERRVERDDDDIANVGVALVQFAGLLEMREILVSWRCAETTGQEAISAIWGELVPWERRDLKQSPPSTDGDGSDIERDA